MMTSFLKLRGFFLFVILLFRLNSNGAVAFVGQHEFYPYSTVRVPKIEYKAFQYSINCNFGAAKPVEFGKILRTGYREEEVERNLETFAEDCHKILFDLDEHNIEAAAEILASTFPTLEPIWQKIMQTKGASNWSIGTPKWKVDLNAFVSTNWGYILQLNLDKWIWLDWEKIKSSSSPRERSSAGQGG